MLRGLIIRQLFLVTNLVLACLIAFAAGVVVKQLLKAPGAGAATAINPDVSESPGKSIVEDLRERTAYNIILDNGLFGDAGRFEVGKEPEQAPPPPVEDKSEEETQLSLKLWGVTSLSPKSPFASASIEDTSLRSGSQLFHIGSQVVENVILEEVHPRWVVLLNNRETPARRERLSMDEEEAVNALAGAAAASNGGRETVLPSERVDLDKNAFVQELYVNYADLVTKVKPELYRDASGKVAGITAADISDVPLAQQLGLENGDVLQTVNNERIDSEQKILEMVQKYQDASSFRIGIMRNGKQKIITYNFR